MDEKEIDPEKTLEDAKGKLSPAFVKNRTERILYPKEHVLRTAMEQQLFIVDDTLLDKEEVDFSHFEFMLQSTPPEVWDGCSSYLDVLKVFWTQLDPYLKKLVINCEVANVGLNAVEADMKHMLEKNANMITFLKLEGLFETFKDFEKHQEKKENSTGESV